MDIKAFIYELSGVFSFHLVLYLNDVNSRGITVLFFLLLERESFHS